MRFEPLEHTADKGIRAFGRDMKELFENAAYGMFSLMADLTLYAPSEGREIEAQASDDSELLRAWLAELLYQFEVERILFVDFHVEEIAEGQVKGTAQGLPFDGVEWLGSQVKAVTHHDLEINRTDDCLQAIVIFDV
jgi:SHS2 domain-containing protein